MFGTEEKSSPLKPLLFALVAILIGGGVFWFMSSRKTAAITISRLDFYAAHTTFASKPGTMQIVGQPAQSVDDLYVVATVHLDNKLNFPVFLDSVNATYTAPDDSVIEAKAPHAADVARIEESFPALTPLMANPLPLDPAIAPGASIQGTVLLHFAGLTEQTWKARKSATLTINFTHQPPQTIPIQ